MSWAGYWAPNLVQWILGAAISALVGLYVRRVVRIRAAEVDRLVRIAESILGAPVTDTPQEPRMPDLARFRKGISAGFGVILIGLLTWAESADLEPVIGPLVPEPFRPLVGVGLGGIALTASVIIAPNKPKAGDGTVAVDVDEDAPAEPAAATISESAPPAAASPVLAASAAPAGTTQTATVAAPPRLGPMPSATVAASTGSTSIIELPEIPRRSYQ